MKKVYFSSLIFLAVSLTLSAQNKWEAGIFLGGSSYFGDLVHADFAPYLNQTKFAFGVSGRYIINPKFSAQVHFQSAGLKGSDAVRAEKGTEVANRNISFSSSVNQIGAILRWEPLGHKRYDDAGKFKRIISPYIFTGLAYEFGKVDADYSNVKGNYIAIAETYKSENDGSLSHLSIPIGGGVRFDINEKIGIDAELGVYRTTSDYLDGVSNVGDTENNDWYFTGGLRLGIKIGGPKDTDKDGIADKLDACPNVPGHATANGCPDMDGDGIVDSADDCPSIAGTKAFGGCVDTDGDSIRDIDDDCPNIKGTLKGCPDTDKDGIADKNETAMGTDPNNPDTDGDGIMDGKENINGNGSVDTGESNPLDPCDPDKNAGNCDQDSDGLINSMDNCPTVAGVKNLDGCPDKDKDGIADKNDKCPDLAGPKSNKGCPEMKKEEKEEMDLAIKNIRFESAKDILKPVSIPVLTKVADIMKKYPHYSLTINGHTDSRGDDAMNLDLSKRRAKSCLTWLANNGIAASKMHSNGYGETVPVATNDTAKGRATNRRVEFILHVE